EHQLTFSQLPLLNLKGGSQGPTKARIKDIFVPVSVGTKDSPKKTRPASKAAAADEKARPGAKAAAADETEITELGAAILNDRKLILLGLPGMGKTTVLKRAAMALAEAQSDDLPGWGDYEIAIPIFLQLRGFAAFLEEHHARYFEPCNASIIG